MPTWVKVVLGILLVGLVILLAGAMLAARWVRSRADNLRKQGEVLVAEAKEFGRGKDAEACIGESLTRLRACQGFICEAKTKIFLQNCLEAADVQTEVCSAVPAPTEILATARWQITQCQQRGWGENQRCMRTMGGLQAYCAEKGAAPP